jgi:dephospho-CoA kinase
MLPPIILVGKNGVGKTLCAEYASKLLPSYILVKTGPLWDEYFGRQLSPGQRTELGTASIQEKGDDFFVRQILLRKLDPTKDYIVDSIRDEVAFPILRSHFSPRQIFFVDIVASDDFRYQRVKEREEKRTGDPYTLDMFQLREKLDSRYNIDSLIAQCDLTLRNDSTDDEFRKSIRKALREITKQPI